MTGSNVPSGPIVVAASVRCGMGTAGVAGPG